MYIFALISFCIGIFLQQSEKEKHISAGWRQRTPSNPGGEQHEQQHGQLKEVEVIISLIIEKNFSFFIEKSISPHLKTP